MSIYIGVDPGGIGSFGWCVTEANSQGDISIVAASTCSDTARAISAISEVVEETPVVAGIDAPMYWVMSNERVSDKRIRKMVQNCGGHSATVGHVNSLRGACLVQGILSAVGLRQYWPELRITESHPKALLTVWPQISELLERFQFNTEHERDAFIGAYAAWQFSGRTTTWQNWVEEEESPVFFPGGFEVAYWFPRERISK